MSRQKKKEFIESFAKECDTSGCLILVRQVGLNAAAVTHLRRSARKENVSFKVVKNRLAKRALTQGQETLSPYFKGPVGVFLGQDPIATAKLVDEFGKKREKNFFPLAGFSQGRLLSPKEISTLANLPTMDQLRGQFLGLLKAPGSTLARVLSAKQQELTRIIDARCQQQGQ